MRVLHARMKHFKASALKLPWLRQASVLSPTQPGFALRTCTRCCSIYLGCSGGGARWSQSPKPKKREATSYLGSNDVKVQEQGEEHNER